MTESNIFGWQVTKPWVSEWVPDRALDLWEMKFRDTSDPYALDYVSLREDIEDGWLDPDKPEDAARIEEVKRLLALQPEDWRPVPSTISPARQRIVELMQAEIDNRK